jgi:hypothetical protein
MTTMKIGRAMPLSTNKTSELACTVCRKQKYNLRPRKSKLLPSMPMFLCNECFEDKREPRFLVIMVARKDGVAAVRDYIRNHRYFGDKITAEELV